jgi:malate dehydrogenase (oxaloacetate-decarboxylating)(NADP+)
LGAGKPVHILTQSATVRGILNMTALAAVDATQINPRATTKPATMRKSIA